VNFRLLELIEFLDVGAYIAASPTPCSQHKSRSDWKLSVRLKREWEFKTFKLKVPQLEADSWRLGMEQNDL
jgi:hypothetical protein